MGVLLDVWFDFIYPYNSYLFFAISQVYVEAASVCEGLKVMLHETIRKDDF